MSDQTQLPGELLYEYTLKITQVVEYGASPLRLSLSRQVPQPGEGALRHLLRRRPCYRGEAQRISQGVDYLHIRADGRRQLDIHGEITTEDGKKIALGRRRGVSIGQPPVLQLRRT